MAGNVKAELKSLTSHALDALQAGASTMQEVAQCRRQNIRTDLKPEYKQVCNQPAGESFTDPLFGTDLHERLRAIDQAEQDAAKLAASSNNNKHQQQLPT